MSALLLTDTFDSYFFIEGDVTTFNQFHIDGYLQKNFFSAEETDGITLEDYSHWKDIREYCLGIIKGKRTPLDFRFIFSLPRQDLQTLIEAEHLDLNESDIQGLYLNFAYNGEQLQCTTGTSFKTFILDKSLEQAWDKAAQQIFDQHDIAYQILA